MRKMKMIMLLLPVFLMFSTEVLALSSHIPDRLNFELLPVTMSATHSRGAGFGFSLEKINHQTETLTAIQGDLSFPFMQRKSGKWVAFDGPPDLNGSLNIMAMIKPTLYFGGKVGASSLVQSGAVGFMALSFRVIPKDPEHWGFFNFCTKQLDMGVFGNKELYAAVRLGFKLYQLPESNPEN